MNPQKVDRAKVACLEDLPNVGMAMAADLRLIGIHVPEQLVGREAFELYDALCMATAMRHDPCVIDVFMSIVSFMNGGPARPWWSFTEERKRFFKP
ncbi:MAG TPA: helix-hairpin-helix domain-containing protein [Novimethylophilus sp.]|jgi:hypothetical protein|uniref:helix-hairpin-helix domain-containing protein n=1 Tax=Novimethylophilus sp. TaxID=2137426 RepID=UPI002F403D8F